MMSMTSRSRPWSVRRFGTALALTPLRRWCSNPPHTAPCPQQHLYLVRPPRIRCPGRLLDRGPCRCVRYKHSERAFTTLTARLNVSRIRSAVLPIVTWTGLWKSYFCFLRSPCTGRPHGVVGWGGETEYVDVFPGTRYTTAKRVLIGQGTGR